MNVIQTFPRLPVWQSGKSPADTDNPKRSARHVWALVCDQMGERMQVLRKSTVKRAAEAHLDAGA